MKQSSIDWLIEQLTVVERNLVNKTYLQNNNTLAGHNLRELFKQAKSMHKDEIENAYDDGWHHNNEDFYNPVGYYNETFNTKEK